MASVPVSWSYVAESVRAVAEECTLGKPHVQGDLDSRIVAFNEELIQEYPDFPPCADPSPWMGLPLRTGVADPEN
jgi:hypothetical protein